MVGWSIPNIIGWTKTKTTVRKLNHYHKHISSVYDDGKLDEKDIESVDKMKKASTDAYSKGKINEMHYKILKEKMTNYGK